MVLLASYTYENARLLLLSKSKAWPNGSSNNRGQVGKHYIGHWNGRECYALFPKDLNVWYGANAQAVVVNNWADDNFDHAGLGFIGGASLTISPEIHPIASADMPLFGVARAWGSKWKAFIHENAGRWRGAYAQCTSLPYENTYLDLDPEAKDPLSNPVIRITSGRKENEPRASAFAASKAAEWFRAAGAVEVVTTPAAAEGPNLSWHAVGGTRMGDNPETNVVDRWGFSHEAPNVGILGGSVMGIHGARNPSIGPQLRFSSTRTDCAAHDDCARVEARNACSLAFTGETVMRIFRSSKALYRGKGPFRRLPSRLTTSCAMPNGSWSPTP
ncbi:MAG: GMC family oxidoreductase [Bryobacterales bacterium]|nr:GMC family oxidoreductase [Bryobacterales bacterium]